jgi:3-hydroxyacyl-[acyl-carrier-protein] dehydratase
LTTSAPLIDPAQFDCNRVVADIHAIRRFNPQRHEFEAITAIIHDDVTTGLCVGYKDVTHDDFWVRGHMPGMPLMPGVMMIEAAAQLASYFVQHNDMLDGAKMMGFGGLDEVRFRDPVIPGDRLVLAVKFIKARPRRIIISRFEGYVRNRLVVEGIIKGIPLPVDALAQIKEHSPPPT